MLNNKSFLVLIPARGGSKGIKLKNLINFNGKPLVLHTIEFAKKIKFVDKIILSSDHKKMIDLGKRNNIETIKRSKILSGDQISDYQLIKNILDFLKKKGENYNYLIYLQPTSPFRKTSDINKACKKIVNKNHDTIWSVNQVSKKYHPLKLFKVKNNKLFLFNKRGKDIIARQQLGEIYQRNGIFYIFNVKKIINNKSIYSKEGIFPYLINYKFVNIDTVDDLQKAKKLFKRWVN